MRRSSQRYLSLRHKLLILLLSVALVPLLMVGWLSLTGLDRARNEATSMGVAALREQAALTLSQRARDKARLYDTALAAIAQQVESAATIAGELRTTTVAPVAERVWISPDGPTAQALSQYAADVAYARTLIPLLRSVVDTNPLVNIGYVGLASGGVTAFNDERVVDQLQAIAPFDVRQRPWYLSALASGGTIWTDAYVDANTGKLTTTCAAPLYDAEGRYLGVLGFDLLLTTIQEDLLTVDIGRNGYAFLVNNVGEVIVSPDMAAGDVAWDETFSQENLLASDSAELRSIALQMLNREQGVRVFDYEGTAAYLAYAPIASAGWSVGLVIPAEDIEAPALAAGQQIGDSQDRLRHQLLLVLPIIATAVSVVGVLIGLSFTRPILALYRSAQRVAAGQLDERLPSAGNDEIGQLVTAFNSMTASLQEMVGELEANAEQLATLNEVSNQLKQILDLARLLQTIPAVVCRRFGFDRTALYLVEGDELRVVSAAFGEDNSKQAHYFIEVANSRPLKLNSGTVEADVIRSKKAVIVNNPWIHPRVDQAKQAASASASYVQVPILGGEGNVIGLLSADMGHSERQVQPQDASRLLTFANMVGLTIENARLYNDLERQVAARTEELRAALARVQLADRRKSDFLAAVSHDLRTPLNAIIGFSTVLLDDLDGPLTLAQREDITSIHRNGRFLLHLINELLDLARIEAGHLLLERRPIALEPLMHEVIDTVQALMRGRGISLQQLVSPQTPLVEADADRLRQIMFNLLSNAVKFTEHGVITVSAHTIDEVNAHGRIQHFVVVNVRDTGIGIPPELHEHIFTEFSQVHGRRSRTRGTGLGLAIVKRLVEAHEGRIWLESSPGHGSTFSFTLPVASPAVQSPRDTTEPLPIALEDIAQRAASLRS
ncbi:HAMP domain-containing protein [Candidatus Gracilibacteria bacterium]|nr:HAMP domain-containing protein [Candidatus Gracilibacteria bacterium]